MFKAEVIHRRGPWPAEARFEVERVISHRACAGYQIPRDAQSLSERLAAVSPVPTDHTFYSRFSDLAEAVLCSHLPWTNASLGDAFTIGSRDGQKPRRRRRIFLRANPFPMELSLPDNHSDIRGLAEGAPLMIQYEMSKAEPGRATIHRVRTRSNGTPMDVAPERIGVIDHVNHQKSLIHVVVARGVDGTCPIPLYAGEARVGNAVAVRLARHHRKADVRTRIIAILPTDQSPAPDVCRAFRETTNVTENGLGFTLSDIFIPPNMVAAANIEAGDLVEGIAIASFDKKRGKWGMRAIEARSIKKRHVDFSRLDDDNDDSF